MKIDTKKLMEEYFPLAYEQTKKLLSIPSFKTEALPGAPYGQGTKDVLDYAINLANEMGFETHQDAQNRYGFVDYGEGDKLFVILCHLDVVPPGNMEQWVTDPFTPIEKDGKLIGRGAFDDKGPTMMNLYALKYLKDHGYKSKDYKIRLIFGLTEETTWESINAYLADYGIADAGYVPDGEFPVVYAEKWIVDMDINGTLPAEFEITGGSAYNVICDQVTYKGPKQVEIAKWLNENNISTSNDAEGRLAVQGAAGHASLPWVGINAATYLAKAMFESGVHHAATDFIAENMHMDYNASNIFEDIKDETGDLTQNLGIIDIRDGFQRIACNYRVPVFTDPKEVFIPTMQDFVQDYSLNGVVEAVEDSVYVPKDSELIKKIMQVYQEVTGDMESQPLAIGGGTYAKSMPNVVAFGAEFDMEESTMHAYNEYVKVEDLKKMLEIYAKAITLLTK
ncbi:Sapep family Mn(2+)-dependent dipeptidase [[Acholeplasma] multilocale]|uniref:Sapep family Mn(2+)-dependent dipeptidase n=1 Tax=[Acholeplasma] multilocale TaxID=264638 RepID=UPI00047AC5B9|nr:Sapep family Mn(2+)-dependent dipeptidase [[Acholeplasma] multilocale]